MRQLEALEHVSLSGGSLYMHHGWRGHVYMVCANCSVMIGMPMLDRLLVRGDLEAVPNTFLPGYSAVLTEQGRARLSG